MKRQEERKRKLAEVGIKYDFDAVAYVSPPLSCFVSYDGRSKSSEKETKVFVGKCTYESEHTAPTSYIPMSGVCI